MTTGNPAGEALPMPPDRLILEFDHDDGRPGKCRLVIDYEDLIRAGVELTPLVINEAIASAIDATSRGHAAAYGRQLITTLVGRLIGWLDLGDDVPRSTIAGLGAYTERHPGLVELEARYPSA